jgi:hypothetical protein
VTKKRRGYFTRSSRRRRRSPPPRLGKFCLRHRGSWIGWLFRRRCVSGEGGAIWLKQTVEKRREDAKLAGRRNHASDGACRRVVAKTSSSINLKALGVGYERVTKVFGGCQPYLPTLVALFDGAKSSKPLLCSSTNSNTVVCKKARSVVFFPGHRVLRRKKTAAKEIHSLE